MDRSTCKKIMGRHRLTASVGKAAIATMQTQCAAVKPVCLIVGLLLALCLCPGRQALAADGQPTALTYRLKWLFNVSAVGDLVADRQGFFAAQDLSVEVKAGGPERDAIKELELGYADFGVASADQVIRALEKGAPVVVICQLFQKNPLQWIYRSQEMTIAHPTDLRGKTIGVTFGGNDETILRALLAAGGIADRQVHFFSVRYDYTPFFRRRVNIWPVYQNAQGIILARKLRAEGEPVAFLDPARFGVRFVANSVVTSQGMAENHPERVRRFLHALLAGWRMAMAPEHEAVAISTLKAFDRNADPAVLKPQIAATRNFILPTDGGDIGAIDHSAWRQTEAIMLSQGLIRHPVTVEAALAPDFLPSRDKAAPSASHHNMKGR